MPTLHDYLLLDGAQIEDLTTHIYQLQPSPDFHWLYRSTDYAEYAQFGPILIKVSSGDLLLEHFRQNWSDDGGIHLRSSAPVDTLKEHLRSLVHARVPGDSNVLFRYYDPRILPLWLETLQSDGLLQVMGPVDTFILPEGARIELPDHAAPQGQRYAERPWLQLSLEQLEHLNQAKLATFEKRLLEHLQQHFPDQVKALGTTEQQHRFIKGCIASAARYGYSSARDVSRWSSLALLLGMDFPEGSGHERYRETLIQSEGLPQQRLEQVLQTAIYEYGKGMHRV